MDSKFFHKHVGGEYKKLNDSYVGLIRTGIDALNEAEKGIYSDCFLLHARNIIDFLSKSREMCSECKRCSRHQKRAEKDQEDNVLAMDYTKDRKPVIAIEKLMPRIEGKDPGYLYERINKQLSHISKSREDNIDFFGDKKLYKEIFENMNKALKDYNNRVSEDLQIQTAT